MKSSRIAKRSDLRTQAFSARRLELDAFQGIFLSKERAFRSKDYKWPRDALNNWSRIWEYPYVAEAFTELRRESHNVGEKILDFGSGVTFFPYFLSKNGYKVTCCDIDPVCGTDLQKANYEMASVCEPVDIVLSSEGRVPKEDGYFDMIYSVSVLEHIPKPSSVIAELHRLLRKGGALVLTIDLDLRGDSEIGIAPFYDLLNSLESRFVLQYPIALTHPQDMLTSDNSDIAVLPLKGRALISACLKNLARRVLGRKTIPLLPYRLAVAGLILKKP